MKRLSTKAGVAASACVLHSLRPSKQSQCDDVHPFIREQWYGFLKFHGANGPPLPTAAASHPFSLESAARCISAKRPRSSLAEPIRHDCGEDSFFMATPTESTTAIGVADGVSSWIRIGIDSAFFAWKLMNNCQEVVLSDSSGILPGDILEIAYSKMLAMGKQAPQGSSTACVATLSRQDGTMRVANLGDSGAILVRLSSRAANVVLETGEQVHSFNCPYQLMISPTGPVGECVGDSPADRADFSARAKDGDLLIMGTDGFFDNVWRQSMLQVISELRSKPAGEIAEALVRIAYEQSLSPSALVPFGASARKEGFDHVGGKPDDITVVVGRVVQRTK